ncbi:unnamed protein product [Soboliphyme baturini]|uniref:Uncharacterized protein n=1 Tax=Soboliphyme baturini TaxID=241478 RepID=A0A183J2S7_9BILA|nr:unnamed protein product [Soboliphyme baturini]
MTGVVEIKWQLFKSGIVDAAAECCPVKRVGLPPGSQNRSLWWAREVQLAVKEKKAAFKKWLGIKEPSTRVRYVEARKAAAIAVAKASEELLNRAQPQSKSSRLRLACGAEGCEYYYLCRRNCTGCEKLEKWKSC